MIGTFWYLTSSSLKNRTISKLRRLRQPQYLLAAIFGVAYFGWMLFRGPMEEALLGRPGSSPAEAQMQLLTLLLSGVVYFVLLVPWALPSAGGGMVFSEAEIAFLFPAPLERRQILLFKLLRSQPRLLFTTVMLWIFLTGSDGNLLGIWVSLVALHAYLLMVSFARARLRIAGIGTLPRLLAVVAMFAVSGFWLLTRLRTVSGEMLSASGWSSIEPVLPQLSKALLEGGGMVVTFFPSLFASPVLSVGPGETLLRTAIVALLGIVFFAIATRLDVSFEDASIEVSRSSATRTHARLQRRTGRAIGFPRVPALFPLAERGRPEIAIVWKNFAAASRTTLPILAIIIVVIVLFTSAMAVLADRNSALMLLTTFGLGGLGVVTGAGALVFRTDLRMDLHQLDVLKLFPLRGWQIVLAEVGSGALLMLATQIVFAAMAFQGIASTIDPDLAGVVARWIPALLVLILPLNVVQLLVQNGAALAIPAWMIHKPGESSGIETVGRSIVLMLGHVAVATLTLLPAALVFGITFWIASVFAGLSWASALAAIPTAALMIGECWFLLHLLGRRFDRMEPLDLDTV